jgi:hypothetical protein
LFFSAVAVGRRTVVPSIGSAAEFLASRERKVRCFVFGKPLFFGGSVFQTPTPPVVATLTAAIRWGG